MDVFSILKIGADSYEVKDAQARGDVATLAGDLAGKVDDTITVNGQPLSANVQLDAEDIPYDNTVSGMTADDVQEAVDELDTRVTTLENTPPTGFSVTYDSVDEKLIFTS